MSQKKNKNKTVKTYPDLQDHLYNLESADLLRVIDAPVNKDTELHPLVRWQFRGGIDEKDRKAFKFTNVVDSHGRKYDMPVVVGVYASNAEIYAMGMGVTEDQIGKKWTEAISNPIQPVTVEKAPCQEIVITGDCLKGKGKGLDRLPVPISTPGYDCAPYLTATNVVTRNPETRTQNMGTYRAGLKASDRMVVRMVSRPGGAEGYVHWEMYKALGEKMPCAIVVGCPPAVAFMGPQKLPVGVEEMAVGGGVVGAAIHQIKCKTVDLMVPADSEIVIEGFIDTKYLEPEAPFAESHGHVALEDYNMIMEVTAITQKKNAVFTSIISQLTPSESSVIKRVAYEPLYLLHLRDVLGIKAVKKVHLHEPLTNLRKVLFVQVEKGTSTTEIWRALHGASSLAAAIGKYVIAIDEDIDPGHGDAVFWALSYRANPALDVHIVKHKLPYGPRDDRIGAETDAIMLVDATLKKDLPPIALPKKEFMENARRLWNDLGLPQLSPEKPWHGYSLGHWSETWDQAAARAVEGRYLENGEISSCHLRSDVKPNQSVRYRTDGTIIEN